MVITMKNPKYRLISVAVALLMCLSSLVGLFRVTAEAADAGANPCIPLFWDDGLNKGCTMEAGDTVAARFETTAELTGIRVDIKRVMASGGRATLTLSLYRWNGAYDTTVAEAPLLTETVGDLRGSQTYRAEADEAIPVGEYLLVCTSVSGKWNLGQYHSDIGGVAWYKNGESDTYAYSLAVESASDVTATVAGSTDAADRGAKPDTWVAVDGLGRSLSDYETVGSPQTDKQVGIFYWTTSGYQGRQTSAYNITERLNSVSKEEALAAVNDYEHSLWDTEHSASWFWDEPLLGYYTTNDAYVIRKHAEWLADAGVDVIFFDCALGMETTGSYMKVFEVFEQARREGVDTPDIAFVLNMGDPDACAVGLRLLYEQIYSKGLYEDLWYHYTDERKPLILAYTDTLDKTDATDRAILGFFQYRRMDAYTWRTEDFYAEAERPFWGWLSTYPQTKYYVGGKLEQMTVGVAQNVDVLTHQPTAMNGTNVAGRSYVCGDYSYTYMRNGQPFTVDQNTENSVLYGLNFQQQWDLAIASDVDFVFVTGWNEWTAGRHKDFQGIENAFPDQFDPEHSRDIEPSAGILQDHYYYQLAENIRRFKGVSEPTAASGAEQIDINGDVAQWKDVDSYDHYTNNTYARNDEAFGHTLTNDTMRNDIVEAKVACDADYLYFYVKTVDDLTAPTDSAWMRLLLDVGARTDTAHWEGFEYLINRQNAADGTCTVERLTGTDENGAWLCESVGSARYTVVNNVLQIEVSRELLGLTEDELSVNFKWSDNMQTEGDILDFYQNGDVAPGGRFCFAYTNTDSKHVIAGGETETESETETEETLPETNESTFDTDFESESQTSSQDGSAAPTETDPQASGGCNSVVAGWAVVTVLLGGLALAYRKK